MKITDIPPNTPISALRREFSPNELKAVHQKQLVAALVGMTIRFTRKVLAKSAGPISLAEVLTLVDQDAFSETFTPRTNVRRQPLLDILGG